MHDATGLDDDQMAAFARWTNLSETTFLLPPEAAGGADYRLRIFTPAEELPFAGHPTLGQRPRVARGRAVCRPPGDRVVQECGVGLVELRRDGDGLPFRAPEFLRTEPVDEETLARAIAALGVEPGRVLRSQLDRQRTGLARPPAGQCRDVLGLRPDFAAMPALEIGVIGAARRVRDRAELGADHEVRAFCPGSRSPRTR